jgi:TPR repeat protein
MGARVREGKEMYRYPTFVLLTLLISISMAVTAYAGQFADADAAYGRGDYATTYRLLKPLAEQGNAKAQYNLGIMYEKGQGVPKDDTEAAKRWQKAAELGYARAQYNLGFMYEKGQGVPQDYVLSHMWFNLAASRFHPSEGRERELAVKSRNLVAAKMTPAQIAEAERLAREWKPMKEGK